MAREAAMQRTRAELESMSHDDLVARGPRRPRHGRSRASPTPMPARSRWRSRSSSAPGPRRATRSPTPSAPPASTRPA